PWTKYVDVGGISKNVKHHTVAGQTFYFDGTVTNLPMVGELHLSIGKQNKGPLELSGHTIKVIFVPSGEEE
ncbi:MAG: hypothetical protein ACN4E2_07475, partial [Nitrospinota bacterium]